MKVVQDIGKTKIALARPVFDGEMRDAALDALQSERFVLGESVFKSWCVCEVTFVSVGKGDVTVVLPTLNEEGAVGRVIGE